MLIEFRAAASPRHQTRKMTSSEYRKYPFTSVDLIRDSLDETLALAQHLGENRAIERFRGLMGLFFYSAPQDSSNETPSEHFERVFPQSLFFPPEQNIGHAPSAE